MTSVSEAAEFWTRWTVLTHAAIAAAESGDVETFAGIVATRETLLPLLSAGMVSGEASAQALIAEARLVEVAEAAQRALGDEIARLGHPRRAKTAYRAD